MHTLAVIGLVLALNCIKKKKKMIQMNELMNRITHINLIQEFTVEQADYRNYFRNKRRNTQN